MELTEQEREYRLAGKGKVTGSIAQQGFMSHASRHPDVCWREERQRASTEKQEQGRYDCREKKDK